MGWQRSLLCRSRHIRHIRWQRLARPHSLETWLVCKSCESPPDYVGNSRIHAWCLVAIPVIRRSFDLDVENTTIPCASNNVARQNPTETSVVGCSLSFLGEVVQAETFGIPNDSYHCCFCHHRLSDCSEYVSRSCCVNSRERSTRTPYLDELSVSPVNPPNQPCLDRTSQISACGFCSVMRTI